MSAKSVTFKGKTYELDKGGFLAKLGLWDKNFANGMAEMLGICGGLTDRHWVFINYLREKYFNEGTIPVVILACAENKFRLKEFKSLFPTGYHRGACKIAGLNHEFMFQANYSLCSYEIRGGVNSRYNFCMLGYLKDFNDWDEGFIYAVLQERENPIEVTDEHKKIIYYLRNYFSETKNIPNIIDTCRDNDLSFSDFKNLFPYGYRRGACRMAGLPFCPAYKQEDIEQVRKNSK